MSRNEKVADPPIRCGIFTSGLTCVVPSTNEVGAHFIAVHTEGSLLDVQSVVARLNDDGPWSHGLALHYSDWCGREAARRLRIGRGRGRLLWILYRTRRRA